MEKKIVSLRLEEKEHEYFKKRARQEGMTFTNFVSKSMYYFDNFLKEKESCAVDSVINETVLHKGTENPAKHSNDFPIDEIRSTSDRDKKIQQLHHALQVLTEEFFNEKSKSENMVEKVTELENQLKKIQNPIQPKKVTSKQKKVSRNSRTV